MKFSLESVVFHSNQLKEIRAFYEGQLGFPIGTYEKNSETVPDHSDSYVNYHIGGALIGFEHEGGMSEPNLGDLVIRVVEFEEFKNRVKQAGIAIIKENKFFFMIHDPEGRTLIFEPARS